MHPNSRNVSCVTNADGGCWGKRLFSSLRIVFPALTGQQKEMSRRSERSRVKRATPTEATRAGPSWQQLEVPAVKVSLIGLRVKVCRRWKIFVLWGG